ncbi:MAG: ABC transporter permease [Erysipelotrichaceae bacterium]|nr:ABC transporter permease [Erysipelotrichaceae bacterium]
MFKRAMKRFVRNKTAMTALIIFLVLVLSCIIFPLLGYNDYAELHLENQYAPVSLRHPFSTDNLGRDVFSRIVIGGRYTLGLSFVATFVALFFGTLIAVVSAYKGGWLDQAVTGVSQAVSAVPYVLIVIIMEVSLGWGKGYYSLAVGIANMPAVIARVRAAVLKVRQREFISAARVAGKSDLHNVIFHVLRNIYSTVLVQFCASYAASIVACSVLGYLEIGISSPTPEWGRMVADNFHLITTRGYLVFIPCLFISVSVLCVTMISHGLRDALDPKEYQHD